MPIPLPDIGSLTPRQLFDKLMAILKDKGTHSRWGSCTEKYVLASRSTRISASTYLVNGTTVLDVIYAQEGITHELRFVDNPDNGTLTMCNPDLSL